MKKENIINIKNSIKSLLKKDIIQMLLWVLLALFISFFLLKFVFINAYIPSESMVNTLNVKDRIVASRIVYDFKEPERQDIVLFLSNQVSDKETVLVKRIIGLPGDKISIKNGYVYVNGEFLTEDYAEKDNYTGTFIVPEGCYFMMGDNRDDSLDSRYWDNPYVSRDDILGKVMFKYYPQISKLN